MRDNDDSKLRWEKGVPVSDRFDDPYYSRDDGLAETRHTFLDGNNLPQRFDGSDHFHVAELGFGTGLNLAATLFLWRAQAKGVLTYTAFERFPLTPDDMLRALAPWPELTPICESVAAAWKGTSIRLPDLRATIIVGDARKTLPAWQGFANAWFLDGFAPARNPEMWEPALLSAVFRATADNGTFATYSSAGAVRRALQGAGFTIRKQRGYGRKREMLTGYR